MADDDLDRWITELCAALDLEPSVVNRDLLLDLARDAAHGVGRPAAPLTTFLVGLAAGRNGGAAEAITEAATIATALANNRPKPLA
jgi:hypothetical protein